MRVFLDIETTGLDVTRHRIVEVAWATDTGDVTRLVPEHDLVDADPVALEINGYWRRLATAPFAGEDEMLELHGLLTGATVVAANPTFDRTFLSKWFDRAGMEPEPWHHRSLDVESLASVVISGGREIMGLRESITYLNDHYDAGISEPDHTAGGDVVATRELVHWIEQWRDSL